MLSIGYNNAWMFRSLVGSRSIRKTFKTPSRFFQSTAEYMDWQQRMISSRLTLDDINADINPTHPTQPTHSSNHGEKETRRWLVPVPVKTAAPFLYSVSPISDRLLLYEHKNIGDETQQRDNDSKKDDPKRSPYDSMLECIYPLSESRYNDQADVENKEDNHQYQHTNRNNTMNKNDLDILRASVSDLGSWSSFRLAKFYSDVDALTADVAYRHASKTNQNGSTRSDVDCPKEDEQGLAFVTAGHYHSRKINRTDLTNDIILRCYPTNTGSSSMEIRTDAIQINEFGKECLINVCFTSMVAVDQTSLRPIKNVIPPLVPFHKDKSEAQKRQTMRSKMAKEHATIRKERFATTMQLRHGPSSAPPTQQEMTDIHSLHQQVISEQQNQKNLGQGVPSVASCLPHVHQHTYRSSVVVYPERRNVHGKLFGGFVMDQSHSLAQYAADFYLNHDLSSSNSSSMCNNINGDKNDTMRLKATEARRAVPLGMDEAIFLQPISIGDHVTFTARVVHSTSKTCRVLVIVEVRDPSDRHALPMRSNRVSYLFGTDMNIDFDSNREPNSALNPRGFPEEIVPDRYNEILMHVDAKRRSNVEGPSDSEVEMILSDGN